ncbi:MAG: HDOD domain-containing protein [Acidobacteria bacterium]|nr:HDOD domain-containing protein [Acidobacteriota bacterium]
MAVPGMRDRLVSGANVGSSSTNRLRKSFDLPSLPTVLVKILRLIDDDQATARSLEELILHDASLSARILRLANSAFYYFRCDVRTISHAIALLGLNHIKSLAIGVSIFESFTRKLRSEAAQVRQLWMHSFGVGLVTREIWLRRAGKNEAEYAFLCGLLHDVGKVVYFKEDGKRYAGVFAAEKDEGDPPLIVSEEELYGIHHAALGGELANEWGLPEDLSTALSKHHDAVKTGIPIVSAVAMANCLAKLGGLGYGGDSRIQVDLEALRTHLAMEMKEYEALVQFAADRKEEVVDFFYSR